MEEVQVRFRFHGGVTRGLGRGSEGGSRRGGREGGDGAVGVYGGDDGVAGGLEEGGRGCGCFRYGRAENGLGCGLGCGLGLGGGLGERAVVVVVVVRDVNFHHVVVPSVGVLFAEVSMCMRNKKRTPKTQTSWNGLTRSYKSS